MTDIIECLLREPHTPCDFNLALDTIVAAASEKDDPISEDDVLSLDKALEILMFDLDTIIMDNIGKEKVNDQYSFLEWVGGSGILVGTLDPRGKR